MGEGGDKMLVIVAPLQQLWACFLLCKFSGSCCKNCIGFCSCFLRKACLGWTGTECFWLSSFHCLAFPRAKACSRPSIRLLQGITELIKGLSTCCSRQGQGCVLTAESLIEKCFRDCVPLFLNSLLLVPCVMNLSNFHVWNTVLSCWMSICFSLGITAKTFWKCLAYNR